MEMIEQNQPIYLPIAVNGRQDRNVKMGTLIAITNEHREGVRQERRGGKEVMNDL